MKPLFIPLKSEFYDAFADGSKTTEFRPLGPRWNKRTCPVGREVVLSRGYGKAHRMQGTVEDFYVSDIIPRTDLWRSIYGERYTHAACVVISLTHQPKAE